MVSRPSPSLSWGPKHQTVFLFLFCLGYLVEVEVDRADSGQHVLRAAAFFARYTRRVGCLSFRHSECILLPLQGDGSDPCSFWQAIAQGGVRQIACLA